MTLTTLLAPLLPAGLALLMLTVGLRLSLGDLGAAFRKPRGVLAGLAVQVLALPMAALVISRAFGLSAEMTAGLVLVAAAPGGVTSNYIALLVRADLALSAAMTLCTTCLCVLTIPIVLALSGTGHLPDAGGLARISAGMAVVAFGPLVLGLAARALWPRVSARASVALAPVARAVFLAVVAATLLRDWPEISANLRAVGPACVALNLAALALGAAMGAAMRLPADKRRAIMIEASLQNVAVALFVANVILGAPALAMPALVYVFAMNLSALIHIALMHLRPATPVSASW